MPFTINDYRTHFPSLVAALTLASAERLAAVEEGDLHVTFHYDSVANDWWEEGARGAIAYAVVSEVQPEELLAGRPPTTLRRSNVRTLSSWILYFFTDGERLYCSGDLPACYRNNAREWLRSIHSPS